MGDKIDSALDGGGVLSDESELLKGLVLFVCSIGQGDGIGSVTDHESVGSGRSRPSPRFVDRLDRSG